MTLQNSCFDKFKINKKLLAFNYRQNWPFLVAVVLVCFCVITLPTVLFFSSSAVYFENVSDGVVESYYTPAMRMDYIFENTEDFIKLDGVYLWIITCGVALIAGIISIRFLNNKVSVNFWHSVPVSRENLMINDFIVYSSYFLMALTVNLFFEGAIILSFAGKYLTAKLCWAIVSSVFLRFGIAILLFFFVYSVMLFAASLTGSDFMRLASGCLILFYPVIAYVSLIGSMGLFANYTDWDYYLNESFWVRFSPIIRLFWIEEMPLEWYTVVLTVFFTLCFLGLAVFFYRRRKSECAGTPVIHRVTAGIIKYGVMALATLLSGLFFFTLGGGILWLFFGLLIGSLASFAIINSVLEKSPKAMFKNFKGFLIFGACFIVFFVVFVADIFGFDSYVPKWNVRDITVEIGDYSVTCDGDEAETLLEMIDGFIEKNQNHSFLVYLDVEKSGVDIEFQTEYGEFTKNFWYSYDSSLVSVTIRRDFGLPVVKHIAVPSAYAGEMLQYIKKAVDLRREQLGKIHAADVNYIWLDIGCDISVELMPDDYQKLEILHTFLSKLSASLGESTVAPAVGYVSASGKNGAWKYDLYASDFAAIKYALSHFDSNIYYSDHYDETIVDDIISSVDSPEALLRILSGQYEVALVYDWESDSYVVYEDAESIYSVFSQCIEVNYGTKAHLEFEADQIYSVAFFDINARGCYDIEAPIVKGSGLPDGNWISR